MAYDFEEAEHSRLRRLNPQTLACQPFVLVVETAVVGQLPLADNELARQAAVSADRAMASATVTSPETATGTQSGATSAKNSRHRPKRRSSRPQR